MANQKEYRILINGVEEATNNVQSLGEALSKLGDTTIKNAASGLDELGKTEQRVAEFDAEYQRALAATKAELKEKNKEVKDAIDLENANKTVMENSQDTYAEKQRLLTALGKVIKNMNTDTDEEKQKQQELIGQYASLNQELKDFDSTLGNNQRNVGDYRGALKDMGLEIKNLEGEMASMLMNGVDKTDERFVALAEKAGELKDAIGDAREEVTRFASDTKTLDDVINVAQSATAVFELYKGTMSAFGIETAGAEEAIQKLMGAMSIIQSLQTLSETLQSGSASAKAFQLILKATGVELITNQVNAIKATAAQQGLSTAQKAGAIASKTLGLAMKAIPLMLVISLVTTLITHWEDIVAWFKKTFPILGQLSQKFNGLKGVIYGVGEAIVHWLTNPIKTFANVIGKVIKGDFKGAVQAAIDGLKNQFSGLGKAFQKGVQNSRAVVAKANDEGTKDTKTHNDKRLKSYKDTNKKIVEDSRATNKIIFKERKELSDKLTEELLSKEEKYFDELKKLRKKDENAEYKYKKALLDNAEAYAWNDEQRLKIKKQLIELEKEHNIELAKGEAADALGMTVEQLQTRLDNVDSMWVGLNEQQRIVLQTLLKELDVIGLAADTAMKKLNGNKPKPKNTKKGGKYTDENGNTDWEGFFEGDLSEVVEKMATALYTGVLNPLEDAFSLALDFAIEEAEEKLEEAEELHDKSVEMVEASQERLSDLNEKIRSSSGAQLEAYKQQQADEMLLLAQREAEEKRLAKEKERREKELEKRQKQQKKMSLQSDRIEAIINTAVGATKAYKDYGWPLGAVFAAIITAMGLAQVATITKQLAKYADGSVLGGREHKDGGVKIPSLGVELERGEAIINKRSTAKYLPLLDAINAEGNGGKHTLLKSSGNVVRRFANGGVLNYQRIDDNFNQVNGTRALQRTIERIDMHPVVEVVQIAKGLNNLSAVRELAGGDKLIK